MNSDGIKFGYFYGMEADMLTFYRIPKLLVTDDYFRNLSSDAKILYGLMLDRMSLSQKNGWLDGENRVYIYFSIEDVMEYLNVGKNKALGLLTALDMENGIGLIERIRQGQGKPARIYVRNFMREEVQKFDNQTSEEKEGNPEVYFSNLQKFEIQTSRSLKIKPQEVSKSNPNNNNINNTELNNTESNLILPEKDDEKRKEADACTQKIWDMLEMDILLERYPTDREFLEGIFDLVLETVLCEADYFVIASGKYPASVVKDRFWRLNSMHVEYCMDCFRQNTTKIHNIRKYLLAVLYNAPSTFSGYFRAEVSRDIFGGIS